MEIILTHQNADFDAVASMLGAHKLYPDSVPILPSRQLSTVHEFLTLYKNGLPFIAWDDFKVRDPVTRIILTDTYNRQSIPDVPTDIPTLIIEHHELERNLRPYETWTGEDVGAATTLVVEQIRERQIKINSLEATLMALGIYADTGSFTYGGTTTRDIQAAAWLIEQGAVLDTIRRFLANTLNPEQQDLLEVLLEKTDSRNIQGFDIVICATEVDKHISGINSVTGHLRDILSADALFVVVKLPKHVQLVCRSVDDAINVGDVAQHLGGGGHPRASAAAIYKRSLDNVVMTIWDFVKDNVKPSARVADLMSYSVQTVEADTPITDLIHKIRRIGHEGYPVVENGNVVGLLTLRDADKALEHGLESAIVRDVMLGGNVTLSPDDSITTLEETMVDTNWGQIPIVDGKNNLIGIVTRTDLIQHWAKKHPVKPENIPHIEIDTATRVLGQENITLIEHIANFAQEKGIFLYLVGGVVRDLLLERSNSDIDFVVEGDAIDFAEQMSATFGGRLHTYKPFGTAKWFIDDEVTKNFDLSLESIPDHIDFATTRSELYDHPTALPTVYNSSIKLDLRRRDFTINTLAVQLSPQRSMWRILDFYGGLADLDKRLIRVLHSLSFVDDPTRILRAVRFSERLRFVIEPRTTELAQAALPMLRRITGERIRNELELMLKEESPIRGWLKLEAIGALKNIHPHLHIKDNIRDAFETLEGDFPQWSDDLVLIKWHLIMGQLDENHVINVANRLLFSKGQAESFQKTAQILNQAEKLAHPLTKPSEVVSVFSSFSHEGLITVWILLDNPVIRQRIEHYVDEWQHVKPTITGHDLRERGLKAGREYRIILERLKEAWLDGEIRDSDEEQLLLKRLINEVYQ